MTSRSREDSPILQLTAEALQDISELMKLQHAKEALQEARRTQGVVYEQVITQPSNRATQPLQCFKFLRGRSYEGSRGKLMD